MKVSIIVPVYNVEKYLKKCLDSLVNQTLKDIEIIVVNDGTKDNSQEIIEKYANRYEIIKSYIKENGGLSSARNYGISKANGDYIGFVDGDDYVDKDMFLKMYNEAINSKSDIVICDTNKVYDNNTIIAKANLSYAKENIRNYIISYPMVCTRIYNRKLFDNYHFMEGVWYEDLCLSPTFAILTDKVSFIDESLYYYYQRENSIMNINKYDSRVLDIFKVLDIVKDKFKNANLLDKYSSEIEYLYISHLLRTASLRFISYDNYKELINKIHEVMAINYKNWQNNVYYKKSSIKLKIICFLAYHRYYKLLKLVKRVGK